MNISVFVKEKFKTVRVSGGLTQKQTAIALGVTERGYQNYEIGAREPSLKILVSFCMLFKISLNEFFSDFKY